MSWEKDVLINNLVPGSFHLRKKLAKNTIFSNFLIRWKPQGTRLKVADCQPATLLKMNFYIGIFQGFWLQISEHLLSDCFCRGVFETLSRRSFFVNIMNGLKPLTIFTKKLHLKMLHKVLCTSLFWSYKFYLWNVQGQSLL